MPRSVKNVRYLRISEHTILPLYIYLDDRHVEWMSDYIMQRVLEDLRPVIGLKLREEQASSTASKKPAVSVHQGDTYQFAFFFRKNEPHAVLVKTRNFIPVSPPSPVQPTSQSSESAAKHSKKRERAAKTGKGEKSTSTDAGTEDAMNAVDSDMEHEPRRQRRSKRAKTYQGNSVDEIESSGEVSSAEDSHGQNKDPEDDDFVPEGSPDSLSDLTVEAIKARDEDDEEEKPKMALKPSLRAGTRPPSSTEASASSTIQSRSFSLPLGRASLTSTGRERTPLFLPEIDSRRSVTPAPLPSRVLPPVPLFDDTPDDHDQDEEDNEEEGGMLAFSQALSSIRDERAGSADEDENEGNALLGDADERRGGL